MPLLVLFQDDVKRLKKCQQPARREWVRTMLNWLSHIHIFPLGIVSIPSSGLGSIVGALDPPTADAGRAAQAAALSHECRPATASDASRGQERGVQLPAQSPALLSD